MKLTSWHQVLTTGETNELLLALASSHLSQVRQGSTDGERIREYIATRDYRALCDYVLDYKNVTMADVPDYVHLRQALAFFQKREDLDIGYNKKDEALVKFVASEVRCRETNDLFYGHMLGEVQFSPYVEGIFHAASGKIAEILGPVPTLDALKPRFGKGATANVQKRNACAREKLRARIQCSDDLAEGDALEKSLETLVGLTAIDDDEMTGYLYSYSGLDYEVTRVLDIDIVPGVVGFVPKNAKTYRSIGVEPSLNGMFQMGIGDYMTSRLAAFGINLADQSINQRLAKHGSITGALATLDLSSASDTIATELVAHLLPVGWYELLCTYRTGLMLVEGHPLYLEKFSSMGNGFTFPLETLIFYALTASVVEREGGTNYWVSVYGDDIICPAKHYNRVVQVLDAAGFIINGSKSFSDGPFRESCGADYLFGCNIRPFYQKTVISGHSLFELHNFYVRSGQLEMASKIVDLIHPTIQLFGPDGYGDGHLLGDWDASPHGRPMGWGGYVFETFTWKSKRSFQALCKPGDRVLPLYSVYAMPSGVSETEFVVEWLDRVTFGSSMYVYDKKGRLGVTLPGRETYKRIKIYTFES